MDTQQIDLLKTVYTEAGLALRFETQWANKLILAYLTLELVLVTYLASHSLHSPFGAFAVVVLNGGVGYALWRYIRRNYNRRQEIVLTIRHTLHALRLNERGAFLPEIAIQDEKYGHSWHGLHRVLITLFTLLQILAVAGGLQS